LRLREIFALKNAKWNKTMIKTKPKIMEKPNTNSVVKQNYATVLASTSKNEDNSEYIASNSASIKNNDSNSDNQLIPKVYKLSDSDVKAFHSLAKIVDKTIKKYSRNAQYFWQLVSFEMVENGYQDFDANKCQNKYIGYVCNYYRQVFDLIIPEKLRFIYKVLGLFY